jgi:hypothetical protein
MASGYVGSTVATNVTPSSTVNGGSVSYTCPGSGVRYAVVSVNVSASASTGTTGNIAHATAYCGSCTAVVGYGATAGTTFGPACCATSNSYSVILGPGQNYSIMASATCGPSYASQSEARGSMSVLEVV